MTSVFHRRRAPERIVEGGLSGMGNETEPHPTSVSTRGYQSVLERQIDGIRIVDSIAWARMNDHGQVVAEWVYWPAIPSNVIQEARRLKEQLDSGKGRFWVSIATRFGLRAGRDTAFLSDRDGTIRGVCELRCVRGQIRRATFRR